ncbi:hypothetical protein [Vulcanisaeta sp. JCM 16161]|uniref:hypothetical protein n=1 Tax=Vulcanisaeta sp. JCM 16161 TaxID=1295372 RepID=UPI001FB2F5A7|nr:hypothetical protein [Vulcanisaeta sp. JCM 16161]
MSTMWHLMALDHKGVFKDKSEVVEVASGLSDEEFPMFVLYAILGDGDVNIKKKRIRLIMGHSKLELWNNIIERLKNLGFRIDSDYEHAVVYIVKSSKAIELAKKMLGDSAIKTLVKDLVQLPDAEKPRRLIELSGMEPRPLGRSSIEVAGVSMNVHVNNNGTVELRTWRKDYGEAKAVQEMLRDAGYDAGLSRQRANSRSTWACT